MAIRIFQIRTMTQTLALAPRRWRVTESMRRRRVIESVTDEWLWLRQVRRAVEDDELQAAASDSGRSDWWRAAPSDSGWGEWGCPLRVMAGCRGRGEWIWPQLVARAAKVTRSAASDGGPLRVTQARAEASDGGPPRVFFEWKFCTVHT